MIEKEIWLPVKGYEGLYEVSNFGAIRSLQKIDALGRLKHEKSLKANKRKNGYLKVSLYKNGKANHYLVHRLVCEAFLPNPCGLRLVNHKDENKQNNHVGNLEWCDSKYNNNYGTSNYRQARTKGRKIGQYTTSGLFVSDYFSISEAARRTGFSASAICLGLNQKKPTNGFFWKDVEEVKIYA